MTAGKPLHICALLLCLACALTSCQTTEAAAQTDLSALEIARVVWESQPDTPAPHTLEWGDGAFTTYLDAYYGIAADTLVDGAILYAGGASADEVAVLTCNNASDAASAEQCLRDYIRTRIGDFYGYMPGQVFQLEQAVVTRSGDRVALLICGDPALADAAFADCFREGGALRTERAGSAAALSQSAAPSPPDAVPDEYDAAAVLAAWRTGDTGGLSEKNRAILEICTRVIGEVTGEEMTDYEKELAIHDWIIDWTDYDDNEVSHSPLARPHPDSHNPYGALVARRAVCAGYTSTFQLFMDLLDIECITVEGAVYEEENEHAWNMVRLDDGEWYCVDITWDDPMDLTEYEENFLHAYFNVTSDYLRDRDHQWDDSGVPEATSEKYQRQAPR